MAETPRYAPLVPAARRRLPGIASLAMLFVLVAGTLPAAAAEPVTIVEDAVIFGKPGSVKNLATVEVEPDHVGTLCTLSVHSQNQSSVHPGNDLVIKSGDARAVIPDIEAVADQGSDLSADFILGSTISIGLRFGPDRISSMGFSLELDCGSTAPVLVGGEQVEQAPAAAPVEAPTTSTIPPDPCNTGEQGGDGAMTLDGDTCVLPTVQGITVTSTSTTAPPTTAPPTTSTTVVANTAQAVSTTAAPEVLGLQVERLPQSPAGVAVVAAPAYTG